MNSLKRILIAAAVSAAIFTPVAFGHDRHGHAPDLSKINVVLVHGAFADGNSWSKVIPLLQARGLHVVAVQNGLSSLPDDAATAERAIEQQTGPVVLVGHSWAGVVITEAGNDDKVKELVYVDAFAPDAGQSINDLLAGLPAPPYATQFVPDSAGFLTLPEASLQAYFAQDLPKDDVHVLAVTQGPWAQRCFADKVSKAAWHSKPSIWVLGTQDRFIPPALQEKMAATIGAAVIRVPSSHVSLLSHSRVVADAIIAAAEDAATAH